MIATFFFGIFMGMLFAASFFRQWKLWLLTLVVLLAIALFIGAVPVSQIFLALGTIAIWSASYAIAWHVCETLLMADHLDELMAKKQLAIACLLQFAQPFVALWEVCCMVTRTSMCTLRYLQAGGSRLVSMFSRGDSVPMAAAS